MRRARELARAALRILYRWSPKGRYAVLWGWPDYEDSVVALERELRRSRARRVVLLLTDRRAPPPVDLGPRTIRLTKDSVAGWLAFLFARYVFFTHRCFMRDFPPNVVSVNVWHGMPVKRIGWDLEGDEGIASRYVLATSAFWGEIMRRSMCPGGTVLRTGLPRNDRLASDRATVWAALGLAGRDDVDRLVVWLPTYRRSVRGMPTVDGRPSDSPFEMDGIEPDRLNALLAEHRAAALVKPHPMAASAGSRRWSHLEVVDEAWLRARRLTLYEVLGASDVLVSDVSSVVIDYLVLDRPIVHAIADLDEYRGSRGFTVEPVEDHLAGPVAATPAQLHDVLAAVLSGADPDAERRHRMRARSHDHPDAGSTGRLLEAVGLR